MIKHVYMYIYTCPEGLKTILCHPFGLKTKLCHYPPDHGLTTLTTLNLNLIKNLTQT